MGSMHHEVQEMCQKTGVAPKDCLGYVYKEENGPRELTFSDDDLDLSNIAYNATNEIMDNLDIDVMLVEPFVELIHDAAGGSIDVLGLSHDGETLLVLDYKFGSRRVSAEENVQLRFYALCAEMDNATKDLFDKVNRIILCIIQPKLKGVVDMWTMSRTHLSAFHADMTTAIDCTEDKDRVAEPGAHCQWCPTAPYCVEKKQTVLVAKLLDAKSHNELCSAACELADVEQWCKDVREELYMQIKDGVSVPGYKVVAKRAARKWSNEADATFAMEKAGVSLDVFTKTVMLTAPQTVAALKKNKVDFDLSEFIVKTSSGTTLAPEDDSRDAVVKPNATDAFKERKLKQSKQG